MEIDNGSAGMSVNPVQSPHKEHKGMCYLNTFEPENIKQINRNSTCHQTVIFLTPWIK
jgi:hypothetical protein